MRAYMPLASISFYSREQLMAFADDATHKVDADAIAARSFMLS